MDADTENLLNKKIKESFTYDPITGIIVRNSTGNIVGTSNYAGYLIFRLGSVNLRAHRVAWFLFHGKWPDHQIDHINGIRSDNRITNLRDITASKNEQNRNCHRNGHLLGTVKTKSGTWVARAPKNYLNHKADKHIRLGTFKTQEEAHQAVVEFCKKGSNGS